MKRLVTFGTGIILAALLMTACSPAATETTGLPTEPVNNNLIIEGNLVPANTLRVSPLVNGVIAEVNVEEGDLVAKGDVLARLSSPPEFETNLKRAQQELMLAQQAYDDLIKTGPVNIAETQLSVIRLVKELEIAQENYDEDDIAENEALLILAQANLKRAEDSLTTLSAEGVDPALKSAAQARIDTSQSALISVEAAFDLLEITAPIGGTVNSLDLQTGQQVSPSQVLLTLVDFSEWLLETDNLTELDVVNVNLDQQVIVILDAIPDLTLNGTVRSINLQSEEKRGDVTYTVTIRIEQIDPRMRWGMTGAVQFPR